MTAQALLDFLHEHAHEAERALRLHRHLEHRDDLLAELWLVHHTLSAAAHRDLDPTHPADHRLLLEAWRQRLKLDDRRERRQGRGLRSAHAPVQPGLPGLLVIDTLPARADSDPLQALEELDDLLARLLPRVELDGTWSQPAGYLHLYEQVGERVRDLAALCGTGDGALLMRLRRLVDVHRVQSRLFDGIHRLAAADVAPPRARLRAGCAAGDPSPQTLLWPEEAATG